MIDDPIKPVDRAQGSRSSWRALRAGRAFLGRRQALLAEQQKDEARLAEEEARPMECASCANGSGTAAAQLEEC